MLKVRSMFCRRVSFADFCTECARFRCRRRWANVRSVRRRQQVAAVSRGPTMIVCFSHQLQHLLSIIDENASNPRTTTDNCPCVGSLSSRQIAQRSRGRTRIVSVVTATSRHGTDLFPGCHGNPDCVSCKVMRCCIVHRARSLLHLAGRFELRICSSRAIFASPQFHVIVSMLFSSRAARHVRPPTMARLSYHATRLTRVPVVRRTLTIVASP